MYHHSNISITSHWPAVVENKSFEISISINLIKKKSKAQRTNKLMTYIALPFSLQRPFETVESHSFLYKLKSFLASGDFFEESHSIKTCQKL